MSHKFQIYMLTIHAGMLYQHNRQEYENKIFIENERQFNISYVSYGTEESIAKMQLFSLNTPLLCIT